MAKYLMMNEKDENKIKKLNFWLWAGWVGSYQHKWMGRGGGGGGGGLGGFQMSTQIREKKANFCGQGLRRFPW